MRLLLFILVLSLPRPGSAADPAANNQEIRATSVDEQEGEAKKKEKKKAESRDEPQLKGKPASRLGARISLETAYTTNLYRVQARRLQQFQTEDDPGERFYGMRGPADLESRAMIGGNWRLKIGKKRKLKLEAAAGYRFYLRNTIANYFALEGGGAVDLSKRNRLSLDLAAIPKRFRKNYKHDVDGTESYSRGDIMELEGELAYRRRWSKRWRTVLEYEIRRRDYAAPHDNRDSLRHQLTVLVQRRVSRSLRVEGGLGADLTATSSGTEFGVQVDRSSMAGRLLGGAKFKLAACCRGEVELVYRLKRYTSDESANTTYYRRIDHRIDAFGAFRYALFAGLDLVATAGILRNFSDRESLRSADELGYQEILVGLGASYAL